MIPAGDDGETAVGSELGPGTGAPGRDGDGGVAYVVGPGANEGP